MANSPYPLLLILSTGISMLSRDPGIKYQCTAQGSKRVLFGRPGQVDFLAGQVTFQFYFPNGQGPRQIICQLNKKSKQRLAQGKQNLRAACPKGKPEFKFFSSPDWFQEIWYSFQCFNLVFSSGKRI